MRLFLLPIVLLLGGIIFLINEIDSILNELPVNNPDLCLDEKFLNTNRSIIVNVGDSITHGVVSVNYSKLLESELKFLGFTTINAGINSDLSHTVLRRLNQVIRCKPRVVTVLIGTNDIIANEANLQAFLYWLMNRITRDDVANLASYQKNLQKIVQALKEAGINQIHLISLPVIGENLLSDKNNKAQAYSRVVRQIANDEGISYVPLNETMRIKISNNNKPVSGHKINGLMNYWFIAKHYYFGDNLDQLYQANAYQYFTDGVHLNSNGANLVKALIIESLQAEGAQEGVLDLEN